MTHITSIPLRAPRTAILRAQLAAMEIMYAAERRCDAARRLLDLIHVKRDELAMAQVAPMAVAVAA